MPSAVGGDGGAAIHGCALRAPDRLELGPAPAHLAAAADLVLENVGDEACSLDALRLPGCETDFLLALPEDGTVPAGSTLAIPVVLAVDGAPEVACELRIGAAGEEQVVALTGHRDPGCLTVEPDRLDFGPSLVECGPSETSIAVRNGCAVEVALRAATLEGGNGYSIAGEALPWSLPPGSGVLVVVTWSPEAPGPDLSRVLLSFAPRGVEPAVVELVGEATALAPVIDRFRMPDRRKVDALVVIDNGVAMAPFRTHVEEQLKGFASILEAQVLDFRLAVTTSSVTAEPGAGCPGGAEGGEHGRFFPVDGSHPRILTRDTPDLQAIWEANLAVGACTTGPAATLDAALRALTPPLSDVADDALHPEAADGNLGFWRDDAHLSLVFVGPRSDASAVETTAFFHAIQGRKGYRNTHLFSAHAITGDPGGCTSDQGTAESGSKLVELANMTGGVFQSICASTSWHPALYEMGYTPFTQPTRFYLSERPRDRNGDGAVDETDFTVRLEGVELAPTTREGREVWRYLTDPPEIRFAPVAVPEPGSSLEVEFLPACPEPTSD